VFEIEEVEEQPASLVVILTLKTMTSGSTRDEEVAEMTQNNEASSSRNSRTEDKPR
jgi:CMP-2-keto-3-deoxyoctulosonic acid synthetase